MILEFIRKKICLLVPLAIFCARTSVAQITFQRQYSQLDSATSLQSFDAKQTPDGGYVLSGCVSQGTSGLDYRVFVAKVNCSGSIEWQHVVGSTQTINNVSSKLIVTKDSSIVAINNVGVNNDYKGIVMRLSPDGNVIWQKRLQLSSTSDVLTDVYETKDGHILLCANVKVTPDVGIAKLDAMGNLLWCKTYGNPTGVDQASGVIELSQGGYMLTGRYISMGSFHAFLLITDTAGNMQWLRCYGDTLQSMWGLALKELPNQDIVIAGSTTLLKPGFSSFSDNFLMRLNSAGDTLWTKIFYGIPDNFENASSIVIDQDTNILVGVATASYPTTGFVPNKHALMKFSSSGQLLFANTYNGGNSHYTRINPATDGGIVLSGFSNRYSGPIGFQTLLMKLDTALQSGCFQTNVLNSTIVKNAPFKLSNPIPSIGAGGNSITFNAPFSVNLKDSILCASYPALDTSISITGNCANAPINFTASLLGNTSWNWDFGDSNSNSDTSTLPTPSYLYTQAGDYTVRLIVSNGCDVDTVYKSITLLPSPPAFSIGTDTVLCLGSSLELQAQSIPGMNYTWSTGATSTKILVNTSGIYSLQLENSCGKTADTIRVSFINCDTVTQCILLAPNAFSPNGDASNNYFKPVIPNVSLAVFESMEIYNRWGNRVFRSTDATQGWDGNYNGEPQTTDTYYYFIKYSCKGEAHLIKGDLILLR